MIFTRFINPNNKFFSRWRLCLKGTRGAEIIDALKPYCLDITDFLEEGTNKIIIKVTNTPINFLEGVERESGFFR